MEFKGCKGNKKNTKPRRIKSGSDISFEAVWRYDGSSGPVIKVMAGTLGEAANGAIDRFNIVEQPDSLVLRRIK